MTVPDLLPEIVLLFRSQKRLAEGALAQVADEALHVALGPEENSIAVLVQHVAGNQLSRWTDFLTTDGEKPDRGRDAEFEEQGLSRAALMRRWEEGWGRLFATLDSLGPDDLARTVTIRGEPHTVVKALLRQVSHYAYHVGQIVQLARHLAGERWMSLSIPRARRG